MADRDRTTCLILPLVARSAWRHLRGHAPLRYWPDLWMIVFPAGMYATASMQVGTASGLPLIHRIGTAAAWPTAAAWALALTAMIAAPLGRWPPVRDPWQSVNLCRDTI